MPRHEAPALALQQCNVTSRCRAGFRVGWAALPPPLARKLEKALFASCLGPTPFSQVRSIEVQPPNE